MKRKLAIGIGVAAMIGAAVWMRELASWRPKIVAKVDFPVAQLRVSNDGRRLMLKSISSGNVILHTKNGGLDSDPTSVRGFDTEQKFPRVWFGESSGQIFFSPVRGQDVLLEGMEEVDGLYFLRQDQTGSHLAWSPKRREVYAEVGGKIWIWDWESGKLKKRLTYMQSHAAETEAIFSPDGEWLLSSNRPQSILKGVGHLQRFNVQTGKAKDSLNRFSTSRSFGFSPDGRFLWFVEEDGYGIKFKFHVATNANSILGATVKWSQSCSGPPKWLPDGRIGLVKPDGFEWRDASGRLLGRLPGPSQSLKVTPRYVQSWALSPDGNFIYAAEQSGIIRRWRAR